MDCWNNGIATLCSIPYALCTLLKRVEQQNNGITTSIIERSVIEC